jgi:hypothetical protein
MDSLDGLNLPENIMGDVRKIMNACWQELTHGDDQFYKSE